KFTTGVFDTDRLPVAVGLGPDHQGGIVPDPGLDGRAGDYLGRDMQWRPFVQEIAYQPRVPNVLITNVFPVSDTGPFSLASSHFSITIHSNLPGSFLFYRVNGGIFLEVHSDSKTFVAALNDFIEAYAAKPGYNNSVIASYKVASSPIGTP